MGTIVHTSKWTGGIAPISGSNDPVLGIGNTQAGTINGTNYNNTITTTWDSTASGDLLPPIANRFKCDLIFHQAGNTSGKPDYTKEDASSAGKLDFSSDSDEVQKIFNAIYRELIQDSMLGADICRGTSSTVSKIKRMILTVDLGT